MSIKRKAILLWRLARLVPKLAFLENSIPKMEALEESVKHAEALEAFEPKLKAFTRSIESMAETSKVIPDAQSVIDLLERLRGIDLAMQSSSLKLSTFEALLPHFEAIKTLMERLQAMADRMPDLESIQAMSERLASLDSAVAKIETMANPRPVTVVVNQNGNHKPPVSEETKAALAERHEWARLNLLSRFVNASGKAREIEAEWQKIQQDENDSFFAFQSLRGRSDSELVYLYKKGIGDGIRWVLERFS